MQVILWYLSRNKPDFYSDSKINEFEWGVTRKYWVERERKSGKVLRYCWKTDWGIKNRKGKFRRSKKWGRNEKERENND